MSGLRRTRRSGAVIFIDAAAAYYSIAKDLLAITPAQRQDRACLEQRAATLFSQADLRCFFVERLLRSEEELSQAMSPELRTYISRNSLMRPGMFPGTIRRLHMLPVAVLLLAPLWQT